MIQVIFPFLFLFYCASIQFFPFFIVAMLIPYPDFSGELLDAGVNRSPSAYLSNPVTERSKYKYNVDKEMTLLKFVDDKWGPIGSFNWFATHGTSMSRTNSLISGDNKGAAARFMEDWYEKNTSENELGSSNTEKFEAIRIPRRVSSVIPNLHEYRKLNTFFLLELHGYFTSFGEDVDLHLQNCFWNDKVWLMYLYPSNIIQTDSSSYNSYFL